MKITARRKDEVACYSLDIPLAEFFTGFGFLPDVRKMNLPTKCKGFLGVNPDAMNGMAHFLFDTPQHRNQAYNEMRKYFDLCAINLHTAYVERKYLQDTI